MKKNVLVIDLDGTLFKINTFHYFIKFLVVESFLQFKLIFLFKLILAVSSRLYVSHAKMKYHILALLHNNTEIDYQKFVKSLPLKKRTYIPCLNDPDSVKILATAAPSCYAEIIAKNEGFHFCIATKFSSSAFTSSFENIKEVKKSNVLNLLKSEGLKGVDTFITDHLDDLPLMKIAKKSIIVQPQEELLKVLKENMISFEVIE